MSRQRLRALAELAALITVACLLLALLQLIFDGEVRWW